MNRLLSAFLLLFFLCNCSHPSSEKELLCVQIIDRNGLSETVSSKERLKTYQKVDFLSSQPYKQVLRIFSKDMTGKNPSEITTYHPNGQLWQYLQVVDGRAFGFFREWFPNGQQKIEAKVIGGPGNLSLPSQKEWLFDGLCKAWSEEGALLSEISYRNGSLEGLSLYYHSNGTIQKSLPYVDNEIHGEALEYSEEKKLLTKSFYQKGKKEGLSIGYWKERLPSFTETYKEGFLQEGRYFSPSGRLISQIQNGEGKKALFKKSFLFQLIEYHKAKAEGLVEEFSPKGEVIHIFHILDGKKQGEEIEYYSQENILPKLSIQERHPKLSLLWDKDLLHGNVKSWYEDGTLESQREFCHNKKNGTSYAWYRNGSLMFVEEYENDLLAQASYYKKNQKIPFSYIYQGKGIATLYNGEGIFIKKISYDKGKPLLE